MLIPSGSPIPMETHVVCSYRSQSNHFGQSHIHFWGCQSLIAYFASPTQRTGHLVSPSWKGNETKTGDFSHLETSFVCRCDLGQIEKRLTRNKLRQFSIKFQLKFNCIPQSVWRNVCLQRFDIGSKPRLRTEGQVYGYDLGPAYFSYGPSIKYIYLYGITDVEMWMDFSHV